MIYPELPINLNKLNLNDREFIAFLLFYGRDINNNLRVEHTIFGYQLQTRSKRNGDWISFLTSEPCIITEETKTFLNELKQFYNGVNKFSELSEEQQTIFKLKYL